MAERQLVAIVTVYALVFAAACGGDGGATQATPSPDLATATRTSSVAVPVPERPAAFEDWPEVIAQYLSEAGHDVLSAPCMNELIAAWDMPSGQLRRLTPGALPRADRCVLGNTDTDPADEVVLALSAPTEGDSVLTNIVVLDQAGPAYSGAFQSAADPSHSGGPVPESIVAVDDLNHDGAGELVYAHVDCGAHTCTFHVHVVSGGDESYQRLTPQDGLSMVTAEVRIEDTDGNGTKEIVLHGGVIQSVGAGPQRQRTEVYAWDGAQYTLSSTTNEPSDLRYFTVLDADRAFSSGNYEEAARLYDRALGDPYLREVEYFGSRDELMAYARFRLGLSYLQLGNVPAASQHTEQAVADYPLSLHGEAAQTFRDALGLTRAGYTGDLSAACQAVEDFANQNLDRFREIWRYGYANPTFEPGALCPFPPTP